MGAVRTGTGREVSCLRIYFTWKCRHFIVVGSADKLLVSRSPITMSSERTEYLSLDMSCVARVYERSKVR